MAQSIGYGSTVTWGTSVANLVAIAHPTREVERVDFTTCESASRQRETKAGLFGAVEVNVTLNYDGSATTHTTLETDFVAQTEKTLDLNYAGNTTKGKLSGNAFICRLGVGFSGADGIITREVGFCYTAKPAWTAGSG
jgi:hypothetical protein